MSKLQKAKSLSLVANVVQQIEEAILAGEYQVGDKLPSTRQLQEILGASLGTIREGLARLEQKGLVVVKKGTKGGYFINDVSTEPMSENIDLLMRHSKITPRKLFEFRATIEAGLVRLVIQHGSEDQVKYLLGYQQKFKACLNRGTKGWHALLKTERDLRKKFLSIVDNPMYGAVLLPIHNNLFDYSVRHYSGNDEMTQIAYQYWIKILDAVKERNEEEAANQTKKMIYCFKKISEAQKNP